MSHSLCYYRYNMFTSSSIYIQKKIRGHCQCEMDWTNDEKYGIPRGNHHDSLLSAEETSWDLDPALYS